MGIESKGVCNENSLERCTDKEITPYKIPNDLLHYSKPCCIILLTVSQNSVFLSLSSLCCYCFLRICTLNKNCSVQRWKFTRFSRFNLAIFPILVETLHFGKDTAFYLHSLFRKHFSATVLNSSYSDKLLLKCIGRGE